MTNGNHIFEDRDKGCQSTFLKKCTYNTQLTQYA